MEKMLKDVMESALVVAVQLGVPVLILFLIGYFSSYAAGRHPLGTSLRRTGKSHLALAGGLWQVTGVGDRRPCWQSSGCSPEKKRGCPAGQSPDLSCWQARRMAQGRLQAECLDCDRFLVPPSQP